MGGVSLTLSRRLDVPNVNSLPATGTKVRNVKSVKIGVTGFYIMMWAGMRGLNCRHPASRPFLQRMNAAWQLCSSSPTHLLEIHVGSAPGWSTFILFYFILFFFFLGGGARLTPIVPDGNIGYGPVLPASPRRSQCCSQKFGECSQINCHGMTQTD